MRAELTSSWLAASAGLVVALSWPPAMLLGQTPGPGLRNCAFVYGTPEATRALGRPSKPLVLKPGPHLFLDEYLIEASQGVSRVVSMPERDRSIPNPVVTAAEDRCFQPFFTIDRSPESGKFRIWYGAWRDDKNMGRSQVRYMESDDGIHWQRPSRLLAEPGELQFGSEVLDRGPKFSKPDKRYAYCWWFGGGTRIAFSPDGYNFTPASPSVMLSHDHDISNIWYDPIRRHYQATISSMREEAQAKGKRRTTLMSHSDDLLKWTAPWIVVCAQDRYDKDVLQFYAMSAYLARGDLVIGMVKNLHDDWKAEGCPRGAFGVGSTSLAWTRDGRTWIRDREVFFGPAAEPGAWDHAHAWIDEQLSVGDKLYLYYGGYRWGHKHNRFEERQIGLVRMPRDRYVARSADPKGGRLVTPLVALAGSRITVNAAVKGELRVRLLDAQGAPMPGFDAFVTGDSAALPVRWAGSLASLDKPAHIEFTLKNAQLYAFDVIAPAPTTRITRPAVPNILNAAIVKTTSAMGSRRPCAENRTVFDAGRPGATEF